MQGSTRKVCGSILLSLVLLFNLAGVVLADGNNQSMPGMNMSSSDQNTNQNSMPGMNMPSTNQNSMTGMASQSSAQGVNWYIVGGFILFNCLIVISAALAKPSAKGLK
ncbi:MAG: hypothetical protein M0Z55_09520 [Peptococcaceae bacterium]|nr:hypothetical protein [Peptococcaceae bacterium]